MDPSHPADIYPECIPVAGALLCDFVDCGNLATFVESGATLVVGLVCLAANCGTVGDVFWLVIDTVFDLTTAKVMVQGGLPPTM